MSAIFEYTKLNLERTIQNLKSKKFEFIYEDTETFVPENKTYSIYYLLDKRELYFTNIITSKYVRKMIRLFPSVYSQYTNIKTIDRENYPSNITPDITEKDYNTGSITRYFVQKANDKNALVYEISESDFNKNLTLYNKTSFSWVILGIKEDVIRQNTITIRNKERNFKGINKILFPLQYWRPSKDVPVTLEKKLSLLKTN
jgi:hypothetical protein